MGRRRRMLRHGRHFTASLTKGLHFLARGQDEVLLETPICRGVVRTKGVICAASTSTTTGGGVIYPATHSAICGSRPALFICSGPAAIHTAPSEVISGRAAPTDRLEASTHVLDGR